MIKLEIVPVDIMMQNVKELWLESRSDMPYLHPLLMQQVQDYNYTLLRERTAGVWAECESGVIPIPDDLRGIIGRMAAGTTTESDRLTFNSYTTSIGFSNIQLPTE